MSHTIGKYNWYQVFAKRNYSAQALAKISNSSEVDVRTTTSNVRVVSVNGKAPLTKISYTFKAGSRFETPDTLGLTHVLRKAIGLSTKTYTPFRIHRNAPQQGFNLYASTDRETFTITIETYSGKSDVALAYLSSIASEPGFKPWEIEDNRPRIKSDISFIPPEAKIIDLLHETAYKIGLGNSLFIDPSAVNKFNYEHCLQFFYEHFTTKRLQITSVGVDAKVLELLSGNNLKSDDGPQPIKSRYYGGELRIKDYKQHVSYVGVVGESPGSSKKEYIPYLVLQHIYANPPAIKYGVGVGILNQALTKVGAIGAVTGINATYSDSGLTGFLLVTNPPDIVKGYDAVLTAFLKSEITDKDVARGKAQAKAKILSATNSVGSYVEALSNQIYNNPLITPLQLAAAIDSVTSADIKQAAKKLIDGKLTVVGYGDTAALPYMDSIKK